MEKLIVLCMLCSLVLLDLPVIHGVGPNGGPNELKRWYRRLPQIKQKLTHLHFYLQDIVAGPNPTNIPIAVANSTDRSPTLFGLIGAIDDPLTDGPSRNSTALGRAQGLVASTSLDELAYHMTLSFVFTSGEFNGSKFTVVGHNPFLREYRELPIIGGSGAFRLAQGTVLLDTLTYNNVTGDAVVEYNAFVLHY